MAAMKSAQMLTGVALFALVSQHATAQQDDPRLPQGPNRDLVVRTCSNCHPLSNLFSTAGRTRARWDEKIDDMVLLGLKITPPERALILDYLAVALPP